MRKILAYLKRHWAVALPLGLLIILGAAFGTMGYTLTPGFCASCHNMKPFYQTWKASGHKNIACVQCHYAPGQQYNLAARAKGLNMVMAYWTGTYDTEYYTEISDQSCLQCHKLTDLNKPIEWDDHKKFNHNKHYGVEARGIQLRCTSCHTHQRANQHMAVDKSACFLCHFKGIVTGARPMPQSFCLKCHTPPAQDIELEGQTYNHAAYVEQGVDCQRCHLDAIAGQGQVQDRACARCHDDPKILAQVKNVAEMHDLHVKQHKVECFTCHDEIKHGIRLNNRQISFTCDQCHTEPHLGPREIYSGTGGRGVDNMPSPMYKAQVDCVGCHLESHTNGKENIMKGSVMRPSVKGCVDCHDGAGADFFKMWNDTLAEAIATSTKKVSAARARLDLANKSAPGYAEVKKMVEDAEFNLNFVTVGRGIHNVDYATALLEKSNEWADAAIAKLK